MTDPTRPPFVDQTILYTPGAMVVMRAGKLVHDPHPSKAGIAAPEQVRILVPFDPAERR